MTDLNNELWDLLYPHWDDEADLEQTITKLKQAFSDAGYRPLAYVYSLNSEKRLTKFPVMTGPEFYSRFEKELNPVEGKYNDQMDVMISATDALEAAGRAAGIEATDD